LLAAQGYIELEMPEEALREIDHLPLGDQQKEVVMQLRLFILMRSRWWERALAICEQMREFMPACTTGYIHGAFCLHELGRTQEAKELLLGGPEQLSEEPTYHYNLGCYDAVLGNLEEAARHLEVSFRMDKKFREIAKYDPDLGPVKDFLNK